MEPALVAALREPTRRRIIDRLMEGPSTVDEVTEAVGVHRTVAFGHLRRLVDLGLVTAERRPGRPGRPPSVYRLARRPLELSYPHREFMVLAATLAAALEDGGEGREQARSAGSKLGKSLKEGARAGSDPLAQAAILGTEYHLHEGRVETLCVFREVCDGHRLVCDLQAGVLQGLLSSPTQAVEVRPAGIIDRDRCSFEVVSTG